MTSRYEVTLNGVEMSSLNAALLILDLEYSDPSPQFRTATLANRDGSTITGRYKADVSVTVSFELHLYDTAARQAALHDVIRWARAGGTLKTSDRTGQVLECVCDQLPAISSARNWTDPLKLRFAAASFPYWQAETPTTVTLTGSSAAGSITVPGDGGDAPLSVAVTPSSGTLTSLTVTAGSSTIALSGLSVAAGTTLWMEYSPAGNFRIRANAVSQLPKRSAASSDDLRVPTGLAAALSLTANVAVTAIFSARGVYE